MKKKKPVILKGILFSVLIVIFCIGGIGTLMALEFKKSDKDILGLWEDIVLGILCSVIASVIFAILTRIYSRNDSDAMEKRLENIETHLARQNELYDSGIKSIRPKSHFDQEDDYWYGIINGCIKRLDLVGHSLNNWFNRRYRTAFIEKVLQIVSSGGIVNVVLSTSTPDKIEIMLSNVKTAYGSEKVELNKLEKTLLEFYRLLKNEISKDNRDNLRIYVIDVERVTYFYIRTDVQCIISPYTSSSGNRENIFLLELCLDTAHERILEDDFDEIINNIAPVDFQIEETELQKDITPVMDLQIKEAESLKDIMPVMDLQIKDTESLKDVMRLDKKYFTENNYKSREWNREITYKFVFRDCHGIYETGFFQHYNNNEFVKAVIELPVGFGCPSKCSYCASARIKGFYPLDSKQMKIMFEHLYLQNNLDKTGKVILYMTGMGDIYFNQINVLDFLNTLRDYKNLSLTLSSNFWTDKLLDKIITINEFLPIRYIQYTYVSYRPEIRKSLVGILDSMEEKDFFNEYISFVKSSDQSFYRINYIVINGINDSTEDVDHFISLVTEIRDRITVRLSQLNETGSTRENKLLPTDHVRLGEINEHMKNAGLQSYVFYAEKNDNMNCGQLVTESIQL